MILKGTAIYDASSPSDKFTFEANCYWITVKDESGKVVFQRRPQDSNWLDDAHRRIVEGLNLLEESILDAVVPVRETNHG